MIFARICRNVFAGAPLPLDYEPQRFPPGDLAVRRALFGFDALRGLTIELRRERRRWAAYLLERRVKPHQRSYSQSQKFSSSRNARVRACGASRVLSSASEGKFFSTRCVDPSRSVLYW